jgi:hypothetical protein
VEIVYPELVHPSTEVQDHAEVGITQNVQAKHPTGTYLVYRISGDGRDRYERRKITEVEGGRSTGAGLRRSKAPKDVRRAQRPCAQ